MFRAHEPVYTLGRTSLLFSAFYSAFAPSFSCTDSVLSSVLTFTVHETQDPSPLLTKGAFFGFIV